MVLYFVVASREEDVPVLWAEHLYIVRKAGRCKYVRTLCQVHYTSGHDDSRTPDIFVTIQVLDNVNRTAIKADSELDSAFLCSFAVVPVKSLVHLYCQV